MRIRATFGRSAFAALLCLSLALWSVVPVATHAPALPGTPHAHQETAADHGHAHGHGHGHAHGGAADIYWAMHGHGQDAADHDHAQAFLVLGARALAQTGGRDAWGLRASPDGPHHGFRIERPPRA